MNTETTTTEFATKGQGAAIHLARIVGGDLATLCDSWGASGGNGYGRKGIIRPAKADAATCKSCLRAAAKA
jgi:hypothetical protein